MDLNITSSDGCPAAVEAGRISQAILHLLSVASSGDADFEAHHLSAVLELLESLQRVQSAHFISTTEEIL